MTTGHPARTVLVLQHVACETLGTIEQALESQHLANRYVRIQDGDEVPSHPGDACGLIVMGGPMSVYDEGTLSHLTQEMRLIEAALAAGRPVLGVCLGSQLLARVLGARVYPGPRKEIGWHRVRLTDAGRNDPLWSDVPSEFEGFHWHGDVFDLPPGCELLASSDLTQHQAFRSGTSAYGFLFHMEVTASLIEDLATTFADELAQAGGTPHQLRTGAAASLAPLTSIGSRVFGEWAQIAARTAEA